MAQGKGTGRDGLEAALTTIRDEVVRVAGGTA
jgi:hypothetical protein